MVLDYRKYKLFDYTQAPETSEDHFILGQVVINEHNEIGVIIQRHDFQEYRTDMFGNCCSTEIREATDEEIKKFRPNLFN